MVRYIQFPLNNKIAGWFCLVPYLSILTISEICYENILKGEYYILYEFLENVLKEITSKKVFSIPFFISVLDILSKHVQPNFLPAENHG